MITTRDLRHSYDGGVSFVLDGVDLVLRPGRITGLVGPNGAGKSTLLSALARLLTPDSGHLLLDSDDLATLPPRDLARRLGVLRQESRIPARLTVVDLVRFGRFPHSGGRLDATDHAVVARCLEQGQLTDLRDRYLDELSGGQRQRAFIAMVLAQQTPHLLLDEPLNNLDMEHARTTMAQLRRMAVDEDKTVVVVLHDINVAGAFCDEIVGMRDGRVVVQGPPSEVLTTQRLADVFAVPIPVVEVQGRPVALHWAHDLAAQASSPHTG